jgi:carbon-monoxide dehydrogenase small subunit
MLMAACELLERTPQPEARDIEESLSGNLCRCTGYQNIVRSVHAAGRLLATEDLTHTGTGAGA